MTDIEKNYNSLTDFKKTLKDEKIINFDGVRITTEKHVYTLVDKKVHKREKPKG